MTRRLRVALYTDAREIGGAERSLANLVGALSPAIDVTVLGVRRCVLEAIAASGGVRTRLLPFVETRYDWPAVRAHVAALRSLEPDVFHANLISPWSCQTAIFLALLAPRVRVIAVEQLPVAPETASQRRLKRLIARRLDAHVAVGRASAREVERVVGLPHGSVRTIHNGVPDLPPAADTACPAGGFTIGAVGRVERQKGFDVLLQALPDLPTARLVVVGEGGERPRLEGLAADLGVSERVSWLGWSDASREHLRSFDVFALPSRFEGFPLAVLEALLAELPVVASRVGSVEEAVIDGETGLLVRPDDPAALAGALRALIEDPARRRVMGARGRQLVLERYTAAAMARSFESLYAEICS